MSAHSDACRRVAEPTTILRGLVGSTVHGLAVPGRDDRDEMGVCLEAPEHVVGIARMPNGKPFTHWQHRTAEERTPASGGTAPRSEAGDLDLTVYSLRRWAGLALAGNPSVLLMLFIPSDHLVTVTDAGRELRRAWPLFASRQAGARFLGYLRQQRERLVGERGQRDVHRPELVAAHGFDTKYAMHMLRLGYQGVEYMLTGRLTLPMAEPTRTHLYGVRTGGVALADVLAECEDLERRIDALRRTGSPLPEHPAYGEVDGLLTTIYFDSWFHTWRAR